MSAHWGIEDPSTVPGLEYNREAAFRQAFRYMKNRIGPFINLPIRTLDAISLQARMHEIGKLAGSTNLNASAT